MTKDERRILWLGKFAFPKVNTKKTKILMTLPGTPRCRFPVVEPLSFSFRLEDAASSFPSKPKIDEVELRGWGYKSKHWIATISFAYYERLDILVVADKSFSYKRNTNIPEIFRLMAELDYLIGKMERY